jgi:hypothetical protein
MIVDETDTSEYLFQEKNTMNFIAEESFEFLIGRADGLRIYLNNVALPVLGRDSSVVRYLKIDSTGIAAKILAQPEG